MFSYGDCELLLQESWILRLEQGDLVGMQVGTQVGTHVELRLELRLEPDGTQLEKRFL